jgi:hypothetical protein
LNTNKQKDAIPSLALLQFLEQLPSECIRVIPSGSNYEGYQPQGKYPVELVDNTSELCFTFNTPRPLAEELFSLSRNLTSSIVTLRLWRNNHWADANGQLIVCSPQRAINSCELTTVRFSSEKPFNQLKFKPVQKPVQKLGKTMTIQNLDEAIKNLITARAAVEAANLEAHQKGVELESLENAIRKALSLSNSMDSIYIASVGTERYAVSMGLHSGVVIQKAATFTTRPDMAEG